MTSTQLNGAKLVIRTAGVEWMLSGTNSTRGVEPIELRRDPCGAVYFPRRQGN